MSILATDNFNRADAANLGANWTNIRGGLGIFSNTVDVANAADEQTARYSAISWPNDHYCTITVKQVAASSAVGAGVRVQSSGGSGRDGYWAGYNSSDSGNNNRRIWKYITGAFTSLASEAINIVVDDVVRLEVQGTTLTMFVNNVQRLQVTDSTWTVGNAGLYGKAAAIDTSVMDDFEGGDFAAGGGGNPVALFGLNT